jgi:DNA-binding NarL/FixJ family response regulator
MGSQGPGVLLVDAVIVLSAYEDPALRREARQAGAAAYLVKGCRASLLVEEISKAAGRHG